MAAAATRMATTCIWVKPTSLSILKKTPMPPQREAPIMMSAQDFLLFKQKPSFFPKQDRPQAVTTHRWTPWAPAYCSNWPAARSKAASNAIWSEKQ